MFWSLLKNYVELNMWSWELFSVDHILLRLGARRFPRTSCVDHLTLGYFMRLLNLGVDLNIVKEVLAGQSVEIVLYL